MLQITARRTRLIVGALLALASQAILASERDKILTIDHGVPHVSTVPAIAGEEVRLFVRERVAKKVLHEKEHASSYRDRSSKAVLFVHGGSSPGVAAFDLPYKHYGWATFLAEAGYDVFILDLNGYGFSPRPRMTNPCNTSPEDQKQHLIPSPLGSACAPEYPLRLNTIVSERDEINSAIDYIRRLRGVDRVNLIGWSGGGFRTGTYTALNPNKVEKLIIFASSNYTRDASSQSPAQVPLPGVPMDVQSFTEFRDNWFADVNPACEGQVEPGIENKAWNVFMRFDPLGSTWGTPAWNPISTPTGGLMRIAQRTNWGWNAELARQVTVPTLVLVGEQDGLFNSNMDLFNDLGSTHKAFIGVECATHYMAWERQRQVQQEASLSWLRTGEIKGSQTGIFRASFPEGRIERP